VSVSKVPTIVVDEPEKAKVGRRKDSRRHMPVSAGGDGMDCEGCERHVPLAEFSKYLEADLDLSSETAPAMLCNDCATYGRPLKNPMTELTVKENKALEVLASGGSLAAAARTAGIHHETMRRMLKGQERDIFRQAYQWLLVSNGVDPRKLIRVMKDALDANKHQFHSEVKDFVEFPDHGVRLKAADMAMKALDLRPPTELSRDPNSDHGRGGVTVIIETNLGDGKGAPKEEYEIVAERVG